MSNTRNLPATQNPDAMFARAYARANKPDPGKEDVEALLDVIGKHPGTIQRAADLAEATVAVLTKRGNATAVTRAVLTVSADRVRRELGFQDAKPVERLLIEQAAICYLRLYIIEQTYEAIMAESHSLNIGTYWEKKLSSVQHRYLRALEALARVRRLLGGPAVQVNIATRGGQQIVNNAPPPAG